MGTLLPRHDIRTTAVDRSSIGNRVSIWLYDILDFKLEGKIIGFDEFMNVVLDDAEEVWVKVSKKADGEESNGSSRSKKAYGDRTHLGRLLLKGENITLISPAPKSTARAGGAPYSTQAMEQ